MFFAKKIAYEPRPFYHYRYNPSSMTNTVDKSSIVNRFNGYCQNSIILNNFLEQQGVAEKYSRGILLNKVMARNQISLLLGESKYRKLWKSTFPELNHIMFWGNSQYPSSFKNKLWYIAVVSGLYPRFRFILLSRYLRPSPLWSSCFPRIIK